VTKTGNYMQKNRRFAILVFLISAILVSILFNMRLLLWVIENGITDEFGPRLYYLIFNITMFFLAIVVSKLLLLMKKMRIAEQEVCISKTKTSGFKQWLKVWQQNCLTV
jgi:hypothetical protein